MSLHIRYQRASQKVWGQSCWGPLSRGVKHSPFYIDESLRNFFFLKNLLKYKDELLPLSTPNSSLGEAEMEEHGLAMFSDNLI